MEFAKKYALVSEDQLSKHIPTEKHMSDLDNEMTKILKSSLNEHEKVRKYYEVLQKKMNLENFNLPWQKNEVSENIEEMKLPKQEPIKHEPEK
jgi:hypothetical protein